MGLGGRMCSGVGAGASTLKTALSTIVPVVSRREELVGIADADALPSSKATREKEECMASVLLTKGRSERECQREGILRSLRLEGTTAYRK